MIMWIPDLNIVKYLYYSHSKTHGFNHIIRVWLYAIDIVQHYPKADLDLISAAALFHDIDRQYDLIDFTHGKLSAQWIKEVFPLFFPNFPKEKIDPLAKLCQEHHPADSTLTNISLELKIIKDADALDRFRLPPLGGRLKKRYLRLDYSKKESTITQAKEAYFKTKTKSNILNIISEDDYFRKFRDNSYINTCLNRIQSTSNPISQLFKNISLLEKDNYISRKELTNLFEPGLYFESKQYNKRFTDTFFLNILKWIKKYNNQDYKSTSLCLKNLNVLLEQFPVSSSNQQELLTLWQNDIFHLVGLYYQKYHFINPNLNLYFQAKNHSQSSIKENLELQTSILLKLYKKGLDITTIIDSYLASLYLQKEMVDLKTLSALINCIKNPAIKKKWQNLQSIAKALKNKGKYSYRKVLLEFTEETSPNNLITIKQDFGQTKRIYRKEILNSNDRVCMRIKFINVKKILFNNERFMSSLDFPLRKSTRQLVKITGLEKNYLNYVKDITQRQGLFRFLFQSKHNAKYGYLANGKTLLPIDIHKNIKAIPKSPTYFSTLALMYFRYGDAVITFKDKVQKYTIFSFLDSLFQYRHLSLTYEDAVKARQILSHTPPHQFIIKGQVGGYLIGYIEARILKNLTPKDIAQITIPPWTYFLNRNKVKELQNLYPDIKWRISKVDLKSLYTKYGKPLVSRI